MAQGIPQPCVVHALNVNEFAPSSVRGKEARETESVGQGSDP